MLENLQACLYIYLFLKKNLNGKPYMANTVIVVKVEIKKNCEVLKLVFKAV